MNITDVQTSHQNEPIFDRLGAIFNRQDELARKYHPIEDANGLLQTHDYPINLHDSKGQARLKDFAWRTTEELMEAVDALANEGPSIHVYEELADSLHFLVEMMLIAGITRKDVHYFIFAALGDTGSDVDTWELIWLHRTALQYPQGFASTKLGKVIQFLRLLGMTCHTLKNKPWKQTQMLTDEKEFKNRMLNTFFAFVDICISFKLSSQDMFDLYFKKSEVNRFRQRSKY